MANKRIEILDSLRGIAALIVVEHHLVSIEFDKIRSTSPAWLFSILEFISQQNHKAVLFFFVLSGFSIALSLRDKDILVKENLNEYFYRRFKRILPIYWMALVLSLLIALLRVDIPQEYYNWKSLMGNLLFLQTAANTPPYWFPPYAGNGPLWSLAYEMFFYLIFPLFYFIRTRYLRYLSDPFILATLFVVSIAALVLNKLFFIPWLIFSVYFIVWYLGFILGKYYLNRINQNFTFLTSTFLAISLQVLSYKFPSDSLASVKEGLTLATIFYLFLRISVLKQILRTIEIPLKIFFKIPGSGSYAIYVFHYPLLLILHIYSISITAQIIVLILFILLCKYIEEQSVRYKYLWLKTDYFAIYGMVTKGNKGDI